jgi:hypothetical protein
MILERQLAVCPLELFGGGVAADAENLVIVPLDRHWF